MSRHNRRSRAVAWALTRPVPDLRWLALAAAAALALYGAAAGVIGI